MPQFAQPFQPKKALRLCLDRQFIEPFLERARAVFLAVEDDSGLGHLVPVYSQICDSARHGRY